MCPQEKQQRRDMLVALHLPTILHVPIPVPNPGTQSGQLWGKVVLRQLEMEVEQRERIGPLGPERIQILANLWVNMSQQGNQATAHFFLNVTTDCKKITSAYRPLDQGACAQSE